MTTLYDLIYNYFAIHIFNSIGDDYEIGQPLGAYQFQLGYENATISFDSWLCHTATIISITIILVLCCLFVYKIIKLIGGLIR